jgi:hypothetical protein
VKLYNDKQCVYCDRYPHFACDVCRESVCETHFVNNGGAWYCTQCLAGGQRGKATANVWIWLVMVMVLVLVAGSLFYWLAVPPQDQATVYPALIPRSAQALWLDPTPIPFSEEVRP